jgi:uncharacterized protein YqgC (DUF456 family)
MWHDWLYYILLLVILLFGLFINILTLPGLWVMAGAYGIYAWATWSRHDVGWPSLVTLLVLATIAEVIELVAGGAGAKKAGATKRAMIAAIIGGILGAAFLTVMIPIPIIGTIIGVCMGAALGAGIVELMIRRDLHQAITVGEGAFKGRFMGLVSKLAIGAVMLVIAMICGFPR